LESIKVVGGKWEAKSKVKEVKRTHPNEKSVPEFDISFIIITARGKNGRSSGKILFIQLFNLR
jgi:hypothetical protein